MSLLLRFRLSPASCKPVVATGPTAPPLTLRLDFSSSVGSRGDVPDNAESPATSRSVGSFNHDQELGGFSLEWANLAEFESWRRVEEHASSIELVASSTCTNGKLWSRSQKFVCGHQRSGGEKAYEKKHPGRERKIPSKKTGCRCQVFIKEYPHTSKVLGRYVADHDHEIGAANIAYTCLSGPTREQIKIMLTQTIDCSEIVSLPKQKQFSC